MADTFLTTGDIAKFCGVNFRTVNRWIKKGFLKAHQAPGGGHNRIHRDDFVQFLKENKMPVPEKLVPENVVLIIDDQEEVAHSIQRVLRRAKIASEVVTTVFEAGAALIEKKPKVITLDLSMPGLQADENGGYKILEFIRSQEDLKETKVIVISGLEEKKLFDAVLYGADKVMKKPFDNLTLLEQVKKMMAA